MAVNQTAEFLTTPAGNTFGALALAAFAEAYESDPAVRRTCAERGLEPGQVSDWRSIPAVSAPAPRTPDSAPDSIGDAVDGSSRGDLGTLALETAFRNACLEGLTSPPVLRLIGAGGHRATAGLSALLAERIGGPGSLDVADSTRVDVSAARSWLAGRQRDRRAALIVATEAALDRLVSTLERQDLRFQLVFGSRLVLVAEPGEGSTPPRPGDAPSVERLGLDAEAVIRQHRWRGVPTACYGRAAANGGQLISAPHWLRFAELPEGRLGALDLTAGLPFLIELDILGTVEADGARVATRGR